MRPPCYDQAADLDGHLALVPKGGSIKGIFINDLLAKLAPEERPALLESIDLEPRRYMPFIGYPYGDWLRLVVAVARHLHPDEPDGEALRRVGHSGYDTLLRTRPGRAIFNFLVGDVMGALLAGPRAYKIAQNCGPVTAKLVSERVVRAHFKGMPGLLETYQTGVIEGSLRHFEATATLLIDLRSLDEAFVEVHVDG